MTFLFEKRKQGNELINEIDMKLLKQINIWHLNMLDTIFFIVMKHIRTSRYQLMIIALLDVPT